MKTIEQRAAEYHQSIIDKNPNAEAWGFDEAYKQGATDQHKIDDEEQADALFIQRQMLIEKAVKYIMTHSTYAVQPDVYAKGLKQAMEE